MVLGLPRPLVFAWFSLAQLPTEAARKLFLSHFLKEATLSFVLWFPASRGSFPGVRLREKRDLCHGSKMALI